MVDAGHAFRRSHTLGEDERLEKEAKAQLIAEAFALGGIDAMLPGRGDFALGRAFVEQNGAAHSLPYVVSNMDCADPLPWPTVREFEKGGVKIKVFGIASPSLKLEGCTVRDPGQVLESVIRDDVVVVVLADLERGRDLDLAKRATGVDFMVRSDSIEGLLNPAPMANGGLALSSGSRGRLLGLLDVALTPGAISWRDSGEGASHASDVDAADAKLKDLAARKAAADNPKSIERLTRQEEFWTGKAATARAALEASLAVPGLHGTVRNQLRSLGTEAGEHAPTQALVAAFKAAFTGNPGTDATGEPAQTDATPLPTAGGIVGMGPFVGNAICQGCHVEAYRQWSTTGHARAYAALVADERQFDRDCFGCHVTGAKSEEGPHDPRDLHGLADVGCESCHGAGRDHVAQPTAAHMVRSPPTTQCIQCHDSRQDGGRFNEATYRLRVQH